MRTCPDCGSRVYTAGCVYCNEAAYIAEQGGAVADYGRISVDLQGGREFTRALDDMREQLMRQIQRTVEREFMRPTDGMDSFGASRGARNAESQTPLDREALRRDLIAAGLVNPDGTPTTRWGLDLDIPDLGFEDERPLEAQGPAKSQPSKAQPEQKTMVVAPGQRAVLVRE